MGWSNDPYQEMFSDVLRALSRKSKSRPGLYRWMVEHEPFLIMGIEEAQAKIATMYKGKGAVTLEEFGDFIKIHFWNKFKEGIARYDKRTQEERLGNAGTGDQRHVVQGKSA